jgi:hypothetical protein
MNLVFVVLYGFCIKGLYSQTSELVAWALLFALGVISLAAALKSLLADQASPDDNKTFVYFLPGAIRLFLERRLPLAAALGVGRIRVPAVLAIAASLMMVSLIFVVMTFARIHVPAGAKKIDMGSERKRAARSKMTLIVSLGLMGILMTVYETYEVLLYALFAGFQVTQIPSAALVSSRAVMNVVYILVSAALLSFVAVAFATTFRVAVNTGAVREART